METDEHQFGPNQKRRSELIVTIYRALNIVHLFTEESNQTGYCQVDRYERL